MTGRILQRSQHRLVVIAKEAHHRARRLFSHRDDTIHAAANIGSFVNIVTKKNEHIALRQCRQYFGQQVLQGAKVTVYISNRNGSHSFSYKNAFNGT